MFEEHQFISLLEHLVMVHFLNRTSTYLPLKEGMHLMEAEALTTPNHQGTD